LIGLARQAVEAATAAGASDAEAYAAEDSGREVRVHGGEVESLSAATQRGIGIRAWIGKRVGYAYGTDLSAAGVTALAQRAAEAARVADEDEFAGPPDPSDAAVRLMHADGAKGAPEEELVLSDPTLGEWSPDRLADFALAIESAALAADSRIVGVEQAVYADSAESVALVSSLGIEGEYSRDRAWL
jgi:PmbA protein